ncbi:MAG: methylmalonyl Co-A mutase-associated GTPase MeaB [Cytophagaceae bacterium]|nr:methylmalonyl Co-A mutase-associated GTPase MeaB [Cytophagaceae bacterium]
MQPRLSQSDYIEGILNGNRVVLSRAITLIESQLPADRQLAQDVLEAVLPRTGNSVRLGITGVPGVGKSTFIETFGQHLTAQGRRLAVLTVDPSSPRSRGSILGDKTRMEILARDPLAYIRPTPAGTSLGGVADATREAILLCEAAGFEVIIVETVGVGQSEVYVKGMVDFFLLLMLAGAGDELQGVKRGIMEMADAVVITKADGDNVAAAQRAQVEYRNALHLYPATETDWSPPVQICSALTGAGVPEVWALVEEYVTRTQRNGFFTQNRQQQQVTWLHQRIRRSLEESFYQNPLIQNRLTQLEAAVRAGERLPVQAASELLNIFGAK